MNTTISPLRALLARYREHARSESEKGRYFERLMIAYLTHEPKYKERYSRVLFFRDWAAEHGESRRDTGIDLVAEVRTDPGTAARFHAIQCKFFDEDSPIPKAGIDSFINASDHPAFEQRLLIATSARGFSDNANRSLQNKRPPVTVISLDDLEDSVIDWARFNPDQAEIPLLKRKELRDHQKAAVEQVLDGFKRHERGKLLMACGTGKTFTALRIAEAQTAGQGRILFLVPSLALVSQTLTEWTQQAERTMTSFAVCSDTKVGANMDDEDPTDLMVHELTVPATTSATALANAFSAASARAARKPGRASKASPGSPPSPPGLTVVFSTYHSISVVHDAQHKHGLPDFDLVICDEAHRTTGATLANEDPSDFVRVHDPHYIRAHRRLYMTATPRIFGERARETAKEKDIALHSMDDEATYGPTFYALSFSSAVQRNLLVDYKVIVLTINEQYVNEHLRDALADPNLDTKVQDAAKIIGCWRALSKRGLLGNDGDLSAMRRAVAFCQVIEPTYAGSRHKVSSKRIAKSFQSIIDAFLQADGEPADTPPLRCLTHHVDGQMDATAKKGHLSWLKAEPDPHTCRILTNVRCLSEGVDVPSLDAVIFLTPRSSQVDVVQSVGRVMRKAEGKQRGYVILPVVIPSGMEPHQALNDNETFAVVWQVLQALRSHDDRFDAMVNRMDLELSAKILDKMEVVAVTDLLPGRPKDGPLLGTKGKRPPKPGPVDPDQLALSFQFGEFERAIYARVVEKCGNPRHWEEWAKDIARIAQTHVDRISARLNDPGQRAARAAFDRFAADLRANLNPNVTDDEVVEMLAQHLITLPVFAALFEGSAFAAHNPISVAMEEVLEVLQAEHLEKETDTLAGFYASVRERASNVESAAAKQKIVVELYDKFFRNAFPRLTERLGIVYTPVEVVDFILHSVDDLLRQEFGQGLGAEGVHVLDPFTGTGTFLTRLIESDLIAAADLPRKYREELHANELVLLAYYIAAVNIEASYHGRAPGEYLPFEGLCLTDTFQSQHDGAQQILGLMQRNHQRRDAQDRLPIRVIVGNPPYSAGQKSENDNNENLSYPVLDQRIRSTYVARSDSTLASKNYDSYVRAIRWASDRVGEQGIVGFVTNAGFVEWPTLNGIRRCLAEEFSSLYVFHLRGNARTQGEQRRKEKDNVFGVGSRAPIAISLLVKNPSAPQRGAIHFLDVGDYLTREQKLARLAELRSVAGITAAGLWRRIEPDTHGDWLKQRAKRFSDFMLLGDKRDSESTIFENYSSGVVTSRDSWCFNASQRAVEANIRSMIAFYSQQVDKLASLGVGRRLEIAEVERAIDTDPTKISWSRALKADASRQRTIDFEDECIVRSIYRPYFKQWMYFSRRLNEVVYQLPSVFPNGLGNRAICVTGVGNQGFSTLMVDTLPSYDNLSKGQCFPLYLYDEASESGPKSQTTLLGDVRPKGRRDAITDAGLGHFRAFYPGQPLTKEDLFYYIYGLLHSADYRDLFANNLSKELPRIPAVSRFPDFLAFSQAGRALAELHLDYERVQPHPVTVTLRQGTTSRVLAVTEEGLDVRGLPAHVFRVEKMRYGKTRIDGKSVNDKTVLHYNEHLTVTGIPLEAYDYVVNGKAALDWVVERQRIKTDKDSGIVNDANLWATETMGRPSYPLELFLRVITVSLQTLEIVASLPELDIAEAAEVAAAAPAAAAPAAAADAITTPARRPQPRSTPAATPALPGHRTAPPEAAPPPATSPARPPQPPPSAPTLGPTLPLAPVLPFAKVFPRPAARYISAVPIIPLRAAASGYGDPAADLQHWLDHPEEWAELRGVSLRPGMFVGQVHGPSMEPTIPDGAWCLFARLEQNVAPEGSVVLAAHPEEDPDEGRYTVKRCARDPHGALILRPDNRAFSPVPLHPTEGRLIATLVRVLGPVSADLDPPPPAPPAPAPAPAPTARPLAAPAPRDLAPAASQALSEAGAPLSMAELLQALQVPPEDWGVVKAQLDADPDVFAVGAGRARRYIHWNTLVGAACDALRGAPEGLTKADLLAALTRAGLTPEVAEQVWGDLRRDLRDEPGFTTRGAGRGTRYLLA